MLSTEYLLVYNMMFINTMSHGHRLLTERQIYIGWMDGIAYSNACILLKRTSRLYHQFVLGIDIIILVHNECVTSQ